MGKVETSTEKFREVDKGENDTGKMVASVSSRKRKLSLTSKCGNDGEIVVKGGKLESINFVSSKNEVGELESSRTLGLAKSREVGKGENDIDKALALESVRKGKSSLLSSVQFGGEGNSEVRQRLYKNGRDEDLKLERHGNVGAQVSKIFSGVDIDCNVMRIVKTKVLGTEFEMGDMVWGKVKSHPWWPGYLYNEAFVSSSIKRTRSDGHILIAFFGDSSYGWFDPDELISYDPHYAEKSQQSTSKNFTWAVEESVDEVSRRSALGLICFCRNPCNFRPTNVPGYYAVDIVHSEVESVYSMSQIMKARNSFNPVDTLSYILELASAPMTNDGSKSLDFLKNKAIALAYRRSIFEEFDRTYAEAFGQKPVRPQFPSASTFKETSRASFSGPLVFADTCGGQKSSTKVTKSKEQSKKDIYRFKRRDKSAELRTVKIHVSPSSAYVNDGGMSNSTTGGYVFQKKNQGIVIIDLDEYPDEDQLATPCTGTSVDTITGCILTSARQHSESDEARIAEANNVLRVSSKAIGVVTSSDASNDATSGTLLKNKKKAPKRIISQLSSEKPKPQDKKVKKLKKSENSRNSENPERHSTLVSHFKKDVETTNSGPQHVALVSSKGDMEIEIDIREILADLHGIAMNPRDAAMQRNKPDVGRQFLMKYRTQVFAKSCKAPAIPESKHNTEVADRAPTKSGKSMPSLKLSKPSDKPDGSTKGNLKRVSSECQEENAAKRFKKITDVKSSRVERTALLKNPEPERSDGISKVSAAIGPQSKAVVLPAGAEEPTYLVMKYPPGSSLPSLEELKKFVHFGPMDTLLSRVYHKTNTCKVAFLYKKYANVAYRYAVGSKAAFKNVRFMLKPVPVCKFQNPKSSNTEALHGGSLSNLVPDSVELRPTNLAVVPQSVKQLKSIRKKPESSGPSNNPRIALVEFNIGEQKNSASNRGGFRVQLTESKKSVSSSNEGPLEPPLLPLPQFVRPPINQIFYHPGTTPRNSFHENPITTNLRGVSQVLPPQLPPPPPPLPSLDISQPMISLLTRCHDVVANLKNMLGYMPYHSL